MTSEKKTGKTIGILGGGQLGRMLLQSAINYNLDVKIMDPDPEAPCRYLVKDFVCGSLTDHSAVKKFGEACDQLTIEIENVNVQALYDLEQQGKIVYPQARVLEIIQDKRKQKTFFKANGIPTSDFTLVENREEIAATYMSFPLVNKLGKEGYDGRGVQILRSKNDLEKAFDSPGVLEDFIDFEKEISVIVARNAAGETKTFPVVEMVFHPEANLVEYLFSPSSLPDALQKEATMRATEIIQKLDMIGLLAVEMFVDKQNKIWVNEIAPRTHNSGHHTIEANITSQFEQQWRAILNWPLGDTAIRSPAAMINLLGEEGYTGPARYEGLEQVLTHSGIFIHLYGKKITKPFRKMGHVTVTGDSPDELKQKAEFVKSTLKVKA